MYKLINYSAKNLFKAAIVQENKMKQVIVLEKLAKQIDSEELLRRIYDAEKLLTRLLYNIITLENLSYEQIKQLPMDQLKIYFLSSQAQNLRKKINTSVKQLKLIM